MCTLITSHVTCMIYLSGDLIWSIFILRYKLFIRVFICVIIAINCRNIHRAPPSRFNACLIDWLFTVLRPAQVFTLIWRRHNCRWRTAKFRLMFGAQGLWAGRDLYRATPTVTRDFGFSGLIPNTTPFSRLLRHEWGRRGPILTRILIWVNAWRFPLINMHNENAVIRWPIECMFSVMS
jgi:hypothetical protein